MQEWVKASKHNSCDISFKYICHINLTSSDEWLHGFVPPYHPIGNWVKEM